MEVVPIDQLGSLIEKTIAQVNEGCAAARSAGVTVDLPEEIRIEAILIGDWQALEAVTEQKTEGTESQGGGTKETTNGTEENEQTRDSNETRDTTEKSKSTSNGTSEQTGAVESIDRRESKDGGSSTTKVTRKSEDQTTSNNAHNQSQDTSYTYGQ